MKVASLRTTEYFARMHDRFGMIPKEATLTFSNPRRQLASNAHELEEVTSSSGHMLHARNMKIMLIEVSNTSWMFNTNHGGDKDVVDGLNNNSSRFPYGWNSTIM